MGFDLYAQKIPKTVLLVVLDKSKRETGIETQTVRN
jgi:hypothetical protein